MLLMAHKISARQAISRMAATLRPDTAKGGRGMKIVHSPAALPNAFATARAEAQSGFGNPEVYIERYCQSPRHVEIQILGDKHGNVIHLGKRDCSIQRRHQKLIEEAPSTVVTPEISKAMG